MKATSLPICRNTPFTHVYTWSKVEGPIVTTRNKGELLLFFWDCSVKDAVTEGKTRERMGSSILMKICSSGTIRLTILRPPGSPACDEQSNFENYSLFCVISVINVWRAHFA